MRDQKFRRRNSPHLLTVRWSSGSFNSSIPGLTSSLPDSPIRTKPSSNLTNFQGESQSWENSQHFCPMDLPIAFVSLQASTVRPQIGFDRECVTTTINISADIGSVPLPEPSSLAPLDIIILLGFLYVYSGLRSPCCCADLKTRPEISDNSLNQFTLGSIILTSHTIRGQDRIALGYVSGEATSQFQLILPLGFHSVDDIRAALNTFARRSRLSRQKTPDLEVAIRESSRIFSSSPRIAYCHSFFVSPIPPASCSVSWIDPAIGFHTITPQKYLGLSHMNHQSGWHIFYDIDTEDGSKPQFTKNVANVLRHIRTGLRPGYIDQINVVLTPGPGCQIQPVKRMHQISSLRPGEIWSLPVNVIVPVALQEEDRDEVHKLPQIALEAIVGINKFLMGWVNDLPEQILTVHVDYRHSLLPSGSTVNLQTHVTSLRSRHTSDNSKPGLWKASRSLFNLAKSSC